MSVPNVLESTVNEILVVITPLRDDWVLRTHIIQQLQSVVDSVESLRGATVEAFGSFVSNLFSRWSDLDISIELPNGSFISSAGRKHKQSILRDVQKAMRRAGGWGKLQFLSSARVPILKFETVENISCDVSVCNLIGQAKSRVLFWISGMDNRFRDMVLLVKEWAKTHNINNPKYGTMNSYTLCLLIIFHFQTCVPAILPPLKEIYPGNIVDDLTGIRETAQARIAETCAANIRRFKEDKSRRVNRGTLSELFISFLAKFADIGVMASNQGISVYTGQWEDIETNTRWLPKTYALFVEDPFEQPENPARTVSNRSLERISQVFKESHRQLISAPSNRYAIIATLASPQISNFLASPEPPILPRNFGPRHQQTYRGGRPQQQFFRAPQPQTQFQQRHPYHPTPRYSPRTQFRHPNPMPDGHPSATQSPHQRPQSSQNRVQRSPRPRP
uniref:Poly(A) RNA polymerase mitochondrial-like central palm domain-containing protein n=3 Tax=Kalanchoe fedtschenkoi TaxID=63787 RepID=A0A7N0V3S7_KALFE